MNVQGVWTKDDMVSIHRKKSHQQVYLSHLDAGKSYLVDLKSKTDPFLLIETEDGQLVVHNDDGGPGTNSRILFRPKQSGYYRVVATTFRAGAVGSYQLTIAEQ